MKELVWIGSSREDLKGFPKEVREEMGHALRVAQRGGKHVTVRPLKGYQHAGVLEIVENFEGDTYRGVYTVRFRDAVYVLHCFQKKSKRGIETPKREMDLIRVRLRRAEEEYRQREGQQA